MNDMTYEKALKLLNDMQFKDEYQGKDEYTDMLLACKQALDKQIPKKTICEVVEIQSEGQQGYIRYLKCPNCKRNIDEENTVDFCTCCGQALDWSD